MVVRRAGWPSCVGWTRERFVFRHRQMVAFMPERLLAGKRVAWSGYLRAARLEEYARRVARECDSPCLAERLPLRTAVAELALAGRMQYPLIAVRELC
jgi:hypothetical protein